MPRSFGAKGSGSWRTAKAVWVAQGGQWRSVKQIWGSAGGQWVPVWPPTQTIGFTFDKSDSTTAVHYDSGYFTWSIPVSSIPGTVEIQRKKTSEAAGSWTTIHSTTSLSGGVTISGVIPYGSVATGQDVSWDFRAKFTPTNATALIDYSTVLTTTGYYKSHTKSLTYTTGATTAVYYDSGAFTWSFSVPEAGTIDIQRKKTSEGSGSWTTVHTTSTLSGSTSVANILPTGGTGSGQNVSWDFRAKFTPTAAPLLVEYSTTATTTGYYKSHGVTLTAPGFMYTRAVYYDSETFTWAQTTAQAGSYEVQRKKTSDSVWTAIHTASATGSTTIASVIPYGSVATGQDVSWDFRVKFTPTAAPELVEYSTTGVITGVYRTHTYTFNKSGSTTAVFYDSGVFGWSVPTSVAGSIEVHRKKATSSTWTTIATVTPSSASTTVANIIPHNSVATGQDVSWDFRIKFTPTNAPLLVETSPTMSTTGYYKSHGISLSAPGFGSTRAVYYDSETITRSQTLAQAGSYDIQRKKTSEGAGAWTTVATFSGTGSSVIASIIPYGNVATGQNVSWDFRAVFQPTAASVLLEYSPTYTITGVYRTHTYTFNKSGTTTYVYYDSGVFGWSVPTSVAGSIEVHRKKATDSTWTTIKSTTTAATSTTVANIIPTGGTATGANVSWNYRIKFTPTNAPLLVETSPTMSTTGVYKTHSLSLQTVANGEVYWQGTLFVYFDWTKGGDAGSVALQRKKPADAGFTTVATLASPFDGSDHFEVQNAYPAGSNTSGTYTWRLVFTPTGAAELAETSATKTSTATYRSKGTAPYPHWTPFVNWEDPDGDWDLPWGHEPMPVAGAKVGIAIPQGTGLWDPTLITDVSATATGCDGFFTWFGEAPPISYQWAQDQAMSMTFTTGPVNTSSYNPATEQYEALFMDTQNRDWVNYIGGWRCYPKPSGTHSQTWGVGFNLIGSDGGSATFTFIDGEQKTVSVRALALG